MIGQATDCRNLSEVTSWHQWDSTFFNIFSNVHNFVSSSKVICVIAIFIFTPCSLSSLGICIFCRMCIALPFPLKLFFLLFELWLLLSHNLKSRDLISDNAIDQKNQEVIEPPEEISLEDRLRGIPIPKSLLKKILRERQRLSTNTPKAVVKNKRVCGIQISWWAWCAVCRVTSVSFSVNLLRNRKAIHVVWSYWSMVSKAFRCNVIVYVSISRMSVSISSAW